MLLRSSDVPRSYKTQQTDNGVNLGNITRQMMRMKWVTNGFLMNFFQVVKFGLEIFETLQKCCCNTKFFQEITFYYLVRIF